MSNPDPYDGYPEFEGPPEDGTIAEKREWYAQQREAIASQGPHVAGGFDPDDLDPQFLDEEVAADSIPFPDIKAAVEADQLRRLGQRHWIRIMHDLPPNSPIPDELA